jgi:ectoine hydroxylase-related dioxygenase (phytanoyl-CoA dioxygenase family)
VKEDYDNQGLIFPIPVLTPVEQEICLAHFALLESDLPELPRYVGGMHFSHRWGHELSVHPRVLDAVESVLGPDLLVESAMILCKYAHDPGFAPWHQDGEYTQWYRAPACSAWIALTDSFPENGCMRVIPGSHQAGRQPHSSEPVPDCMFARPTSLQVEVDESIAVDVTLRAGEMSIHHGSLIHGSKPNQTNTKRAGFIVRFVTPEYTYNRAPFPLIRARGTADCSHLVLAEGRW